MTLKQALWEIVRDENIIITNQNIDWLLDRALKRASGDSQALKESILERKRVIEENIPTTLTNEEKVSTKEKQIEGEWIKHCNTYECSACKEELFIEYAEDYDAIEDWNLHFCPFCGAKMKGGE